MVYNTQSRSDGQDTGDVREGSLWYKYMMKFFTRVFGYLTSDNFIGYVSKKFAISRFWK